MARALAALGAVAALVVLLRRLRSPEPAAPPPPRPSARPDSDDPLERIESQVVASERTGG